MAHISQERYSKLVKAKIRKELKLKDGIVFNNDYEGNPTAGVVKIPVRDAEVVVSDYDKANGISGTTGSTAYETMVIDKDKAVNEIIDGFDAKSVPDNLIADRLDSAGYSLAAQIDLDGATALLAGATVVGESSLDKTNIYDKIVDIRTAMSKANIPDDGKRYLLVVPDTMALILKCQEFIKASDLGDAVVQSGIVGRIAGFNVIEWNDTTANLAMIAGHPRFATRAEEFAVPIHIQDLSGSGDYIGASAVQGRSVYGHKVLRSTAIRAIYTPGTLTVTAGPTEGTSTNAGKYKFTLAGGEASGTTFVTRLNPSERVKLGEECDTGWTAFTSNSTYVQASAGDIIEVAEINSDKECLKVAYVQIG
jgi:hypothetical protein